MPVLLAISGNAGVAGATVNLTGAATAATTSAADGSYGFGGLSAGSYTVTPTLAGFTFHPLFRNETLVASSITGVNFVVTINAFVLVVGATDNFQRPNEEPLNPANWTVNTGGSGDLAVLSHFAVSQPTGPGVEFYTGVSSPNNQYTKITIQSFNAFGSANLFHLFVRSTLNLVTGYEVVLSPNGDGTATLSLETDGGTPLGVMFAVPAVNSGDTILLAVDGTTLVVYYNDVPVISATDTTVASGLTGLGIQFESVQSDTAVSLFTTGSITAGSTISGSLGAVGAGATVFFTGPTSGSVVADSSGNFTITGLANGTYTIRPSKTGFAFSPTTRVVVISGSNVSGVNFVLFKPRRSSSIIGTNLGTKIIK